MRKYLLKTSEGLAGRILETTEQTTGVICVALDLEVAGAAVAMSFREKRRDTSANRAARKSLAR
jgi:hypothetical protein